MECFKAYIVLTLAALVIANGDEQPQPIFLDGYPITKEPNVNNNEEPTNPVIFLDGQPVTDDETIIEA